MKKNSEHDEAVAAHSVGINHLSDFTDEEYKKLLGFKVPEGAKIPEPNFVAESDLQMADSMDWRTQGMVTPVKN